MHRLIIVERSTPQTFAKEGKISITEMKQLLKETTRNEKSNYIRVKDENENNGPLYEIFYPSKETFKRLLTS